ncbi:alpha-2-macroglobulin family protein [Propylenella binzhouense]|uniref:Alpha-2-macroglobulin n=1 Tax=Propylenella binzhouense TaxID=2555902 RepID=A0A964T3R9_9HYPH|nr:alpha-2-macroglobulin family protein [Propylenella binzhouense]MYZ47941.1 alpha-2-macroglobulin [Propylenella binzhouense]
MVALARALRGSLAVALLLALSLQASAQERRLLVTEGADYFGSDYDVRKGVDLEACEAACVGDAQCQAFTFNTRAGWCFLKNGVGELRAVAGAVSGRIAGPQPSTVDRAAVRTAELRFLPQPYLDEARRFAGEAFQPAMEGSPEAIAADARRADAAGDHGRAAALYRTALRLRPERVDLWLAFTRAAAGETSSFYEAQQKILRDRTAGAINAYLRADAAADRAGSLVLLSDALAAREAWRPAIAALRASLAIRADAGLATRLDEMVAQHGFRITEHQVDSDAASPRICVLFSDPLPAGRADLADFVRAEGPGSLSVEVESRQICVDGAEHGARYRVSLRAGLPAADGETLARTVDLDIYVRDRAPSVRFPGTAYVLPAGGEPTIPVVSVNTDRIEASLYRVGDRQLARTVGDGSFLRQLSSYEGEEIAAQTGEEVWKGSVEVRRELNREETTAIPVGAMVARLAKGAYVLVARAAGAREEWGPEATQWFIVTDLGIATLDGNDGLHVFVRSLGSAASVAGAKLRLVALNNEILGEAETDAGGYARFAPGLTRGTGGMSPALVVAETGAGDYSVLDLTRSGFDLTDRGVEGRPPPGPLDVFLSTDRGVYRPGETVHATALVRDPRAEAVTGVPLTLIVTRPDGKESERRRLSDQGLGGLLAEVSLAPNAMRGTWRAAIHADPKGKALAEESLLVEDFQPERLTFDLASDAAALDPEAPPAVTVDARFLYGAPAGGLDVEGETQVRSADALAAFPGYRFGLASEPFDQVSEPFAGTSTDEDGRATLALKMPPLTRVSHPLEAIVNVRVLDPGGRPVERSLTLPVAGSESRAGLRPLFEDAVDENSTARFDAILVGADGSRAAGDLSWSLYKVRTDFQWFRSDGRWDYETTRSRNRVASGTVAAGAEEAGRISAPVEWGEYELEVAAAGEALPASVSFEAGWYVEPKALDTPEGLKVSLDKPSYRVGETATIHLESRFPGVGLLMVADDRLIATKAVEVAAEGTDVTLPVTRDWGPGAYVTASLYRPMDIAARRMPARALGLAWAAVDPGDRLLDLDLSAPAVSRPRGPLDVDLAIGNLAAGEEAYVTLAAVDVGILNLTRYETPAPDDWYFGQRQLGVAIRDLYDQLIDRMQGVRGIVRSGGDAGGLALAGPPPTEALLAWHSGIVRAGPDGRARFSIPIPDFTGTVRLMAMAWTKSGVGHAERDAVLRDPIVVSASAPRILAPGDRSRIALDLHAVEDVAGNVRLAVASDGPAIRIGEAEAGRDLAVEAGARRTVLVPVEAGSAGDAGIAVTLTLPDGSTLDKRLTVPVRYGEPPVVRVSQVRMPDGGRFTIGADAFSGLVPETASLFLSASGAGPLNVPAIVRGLDRYPYGCTEQLASRALPLLYLDSVSLAVGLGDDPDARARIEKAVAGILGNQAASGGFGLWGPGGDDFWLDAYVTDFLTRAREAGFAVPDAAFDLALDNLRNRLAYAPDFESGGEDVAYGLYVLAKNGRASIGDLRYYADTKLADFGTPLAKAQIGAALALYGDRLRADEAFRAALGLLDQTGDTGGWRSDYGTGLRDGAAILTLASETGSDAVEYRRLAERVGAERAAAAHTSTQEDAWSLLAAHALMERAEPLRFLLDGREIGGPLFRSIPAEAALSRPPELENRSGRPADLAVTIRGVPSAPEPASGNGYEIARAYFTLEGEPADPASVAQGTRLVTILTVTTSEAGGGRLLVEDPLPGGFEIDNPNLLAAGQVPDLAAFDAPAETSHVEFRADRFAAALDRSPEEPTRFQLAYVVRAVSPGVFAHPAAHVEDMYRPELRARSDSGRVEVVGPLR